MSDKVNQLIESIKALTVLELSELVKALEDEFGVSAAAPVAARLCKLVPERPLMAAVGVLVIVLNVINVIM